MIGRRISIGLAILAVSGVVSFAQTPVLSNIEAPYAAVQGSVQIAGHSYGPGAVAYGPAGTPLVLTGSDLGTTGTVTFIAYKNGAVSTNVQPTVATPTMWTSTMIFLPVPIGAYSGMIQVTMEGKNSNLLPYAGGLRGLLPGRTDNDAVADHHGLSARRCGGAELQRSPKRDRRHAVLYMVGRERHGSCRTLTQRIYRNHLRNADHRCIPRQRDL